MMPVAETMRRKLEDALTPERIDLIDESHKHAGHAGHDGRGESHFRLTVVAEAFGGMSRVDRQRTVYRILEAELADRVHALALKTLTPAEAAALPARR